MKDHIHSEYLHEPLNTVKRKQIVSKLVKYLENKNFDAIAFRGNSGALVAIPVAHMMDKNLLLVRKGGSHSSSKVEGAFPDGPANYIIIDDHIDTGKTMKTIINKIYQFNPAYKCVGIFLYANDSDDYWIPNDWNWLKDKISKNNIPIYHTRKGRFRKAQ